MQTQMNPKAIKLTKKTRSLLFFLYLFSKKNSEQFSFRK